MLKDLTIIIAVVIGVVVGVITTLALQGFTWTKRGNFSEAGVYDPDTGELIKEEEDDT